MTGYTRQSTAAIVAGQEVKAQPVADEFNQLEAAFNSVSGHTHDASTGNGPKISLTTSVSGILPAANGGTGLGTIAGFATLIGVETLKNKSLEDVSTWFIDDLDNTKRVKIQAGNITTGTTRTWTSPDASGEVILDTATQTLSSKTLTAPILGGNTTLTGTMDLTGGIVTFRDDRFLIVDNGDVTKRMAFEVSNIPSATTRTVGAPNASGTLVTLLGADTLTNKSLQDSTTFFIDDVDATKRVQLQVSSVATGTTRTLTVPDASGVLVLDTNTQTLSGKTLTTPTINGATISGTWAGNATFSGTLTLTRPTVTLQDTTTTFQDNADNTKQANFELSLITTGTTRTITLPNANKTLIGTVDIPNYIAGLTIANDVTDAVNDIVISTGSCMDSTNTDSMTVSSTLIKRLDAAWTVGTNQGGRDTGSIADATWHVFVIKRLDTQVVDVLLSQSASAPTMPSPYTLFRRIGSIIRTAGSIIGFQQDGDYFTLSVTSNDINVTNPGTAAVLGTLNVPFGIRVRWMGLLTLVAGTSNSTLYHMYISDPGTADQTPSVNFYHNQIQNDVIYGSSARAVGWSECWTNVASQLRYRVSTSDAGLIVRLSTRGWVDQRGK